MRRIERFGLKAVTGSDVFYYHDYLYMMTAEEIVTAYQSQQQSANVAEWTASNPRLAEVLVEAAKLYEMTNG